MPILKNKTLSWSETGTIGALATILRENVARLQVQERINLYAILVDCRVTITGAISVGEKATISGGVEVSTSAKFGQEDHIKIRAPVAASLWYFSSAAGQEGMCGLPSHADHRMCGSFESPIDVINEPGALYVHAHLEELANGVCEYCFELSVTIYYTGR